MLETVRNELEGFVRERPTLYWTARSFRLWLGRHVLRPRTVAGVPGRVHPNDLMMRFGPAGYSAAGEDAARLVAEALADAGLRAEDIRACLDFGSGYGRVLRYVVKQINAARVWAADADEDAVRFCAAEFGVHPLDLANWTAPPPAFDLVYAVSVATHVPQDGLRDLVRLWTRGLERGGLLLLTTHGRPTLSRLDVYGEWCAAEGDAIRAEVESSGFSYRPYPHYPGTDYGLAWHDPAYVEAEVARTSDQQLSLREYRPAALDGHQDVFVFGRR